ARDLRIRARYAHGPLRLQKIADAVQSSMGGCVMSLEEMTKIENLKSWTSGVDVDWDAIQQLRNIAALPILAGHVAVMPDVHLGKGATVGSVIPTKAAIIPSAVGVDIGCGMAAVRTAISADDLPDSLSGLRSRIEALGPVGF